MNLQLKITLGFIDDPRVWRRVVVPDSITLKRLHRVIQTAFGWKDEHLHLYHVGRNPYARGTLYFGDPEQFQLAPGWQAAETVDEANTNLVQARLAVRNHPSSRTMLFYEYDMGDGWVHGIAFERPNAQTKAMTHIVCLDGEGTCPPEDCGGPSGYGVIREATDARSVALMKSAVPFDRDRINAQLRKEHPVSLVHAA